jgi:hypothetical protein
MNRTGGGDKETEGDVDHDGLEARDSITDDLATLERVRAGLAKLGDEPIPRWVAERLDGAIANEALHMVEDHVVSARTSSADPASTRGHAGRPVRRGVSSLIEDLAPVTLAVVDFVCTTPQGAPPEPIELAVQTVRVDEGVLRRAWAWGGLIKPPPHGSPTLVDTERTGITASMLASSFPASRVLAELDGRLDVGPLMLVAYDAAATSRLLFEWRELCPRTASTDLIDLRRLALHTCPDLPGHTFDDVATHLGIAISDGRHRAMADVQLAVEVLFRLIDNSSHRMRGATLLEVAYQRAPASRSERHPK